MVLGTTHQSKIEEEAELRSVSKPLILPEKVARLFHVDTRYGRVIAPFITSRREMFHKSPYMKGDHIKIKGTDKEDDQVDTSDLTFFSNCERQYLLQYMIDARIREAVRRKLLSAHTRVDYFPLHDSGGEETRSLTWLRQHWAILFRRERLFSVLRIWQNPHQGLNEPLDEIRNYFGDQITMYFAFLSFYTRWLTYPAILGVVFQIWTVVEGDDNWGLVIYCVFITIWATMMIKHWERKQSALAYNWNTSDLAAEEQVRREFYIVIDKLNNRPTTSDNGDTNGKELNDSMLSNVVVKNSKTGQAEYKVPKLHRLWSYGKSLSFILVLLVCVLIVFIYFYLIDAIAQFWNCTYGKPAGAAIHSILVVLMGWFYKWVAVKLNDMEDHRTDVKYENAMIFKIFVFEFCNNFLAMIWIAFLSYRTCSRMAEFTSSLTTGDLDAKPCLLRDVESRGLVCTEYYREQMMSELQLKLGALLVTRMISGNLGEIGFYERVSRIFMPRKDDDEDSQTEQTSSHGDPPASLQEQQTISPSGSRRRLSGFQTVKAMGRRFFDHEKDSGFVPKTREWWIYRGKKEAKLEVYGGGGDARTVDDYQELVLQFSFVVLFGVAFPIAGLLALISNLFEIYVDSYKLCHNLQRPLAERVASIPQSWIWILKIVVLSSVVTNIAIIFSVADTAVESLGLPISGAEKWLAAFAFEHVMIVSILLFFALIPNEPKHIVKLKGLSKRIQRQFLVNDNEPFKENQDEPRVRRHSLKESEASFDDHDNDLNILQASTSKAQSLEKKETLVTTAMPNFKEGTNENAEKIPAIPEEIEFPVAPTKPNLKEALHKSSVSVLSNAEKQNRPTVQEPEDEKPIEIRQGVGQTKVQREKRDRSSGSKKMQSTSSASPLRQPNGMLVEPRDRLSGGQNIWTQPRAGLGTMSLIMHGMKPRMPIRHAPKSQPPSLIPSDAQSLSTSLSNRPTSPRQLDYSESKLYISTPESLTTSPLDKFWAQGDEIGRNIAELRQRTREIQSQYPRTSIGVA